MREWLREIRVAKKLKHEDVSKLCQISRSYYTRIELGEKTPSVKVAKCLGDTLNFNWVYFFEGERSFKEHREA